MTLDKLINYYNQYYNEVMTWYDGLTFLEQVGVLFVLFVVIFGFVVYLKLRK